MKYTTAFRSMGVFSRKEAYACMQSGRAARDTLAAYVRRGELARIGTSHYVFVREDGYDPFFIACRLAEGAVISHESALQYHGFLVRSTSTVFVTAPKRRVSLDHEGSRFVFVSGKTDSGVLCDDMRHIRVTGIERTVVDCICTLKSREALLSLADVLRRIEYVSETLLCKQLALHDSPFLYQKTGWMCAHFLTARLSHRFYQICHAHAGAARDIFGGKRQEAHELDTYWRIYTPTDLKITALPPTDDMTDELQAPEQEVPELFFFDKNFDIFHQKDMWMGKL